MAANAVKLPPGFELDQESDAHNLPPGFELDNVPTPPGALESATLGAAQGATAGFADEGAAALQAAVRKGKELLLGGPKTSTIDDYRKARDVYRANFHDAEEANPKTYLAGELGGGAATIAIPGMGEMNAAKLAALGGLQGLGNSEADLTKDDIGGAGRDTVIGAGTGLLMGIALPPAMKAAGWVSGKVGDAAGWAAKKALSALMGPSGEAIEARLANPGMIRNAKPVEALARELPQSLQMLEDQIGKQTDDALSKLSTSPYLDDNALPKDDLVGILDNARHALGRGVSDATVRAKDMIDRYSFRLKNLHNTVSESELGDIMRDIRHDINWNDPAAGPANDALKTIQGRIDEVLKTQNKDYEAAMAPLADNVRLLDKAKQIFSIQNVPGKGMVPSNATPQAIQSATKDTKIMSQDVLDKLKSVTGRDYLEEAQNAKFAKEFEGGSTNGSRRVNAMAGLGAGVGTTVGHFMGMPGAGAVGGGAVGAGAGAYLDKEGGKMAGNLIDWYATNRPDALGKYAAVFAKSAARGSQAVTVDHFVLMNTDPEYRQMIKKLQKDSQNNPQQEE